MLHTKQNPFKGPGNHPFTHLKTNPACSTLADGNASSPAITVPATLHSGILVNSKRHQTPGRNGVRYLAASVCLHKGLYTQLTSFMGWITPLKLPNRGGQVGKQIGMVEVFDNSSYVVGVYKLAKTYS